MPEVSAGDQHALALNTFRFSWVFHAWSPYSWGVKVNLAAAFGDL